MGGHPYLIMHWILTYLNMHMCSLLNNINNISVPTRQADGLWAPPVCWTGPEAAALYWSFDTADGLAFMEGTTRMNFAPLLPGKVDSIY